MAELPKNEPFGRSAFLFRKIPATGEVIPCEKRLS